MQNRLEYVGGQKLLGVGVEELEKVLFKELGLLKEFFDKIKAEMGI